MLFAVALAAGEAYPGRKPLFASEPPDPQECPAGVSRTTCSTCKTTVTPFYQDYTDRADWLRGSFEPHNPRYVLRARGGLLVSTYATSGPVRNGTEVERINEALTSAGVAADVDLDSSTGQGRFRVQLEGTVSNSADGPHTGRWVVESIPGSFQGVAATGKAFTTNGITSNILMHGCTRQGEAAYPEINVQVSTWGHCNVLLDGAPFAREVWCHLMFHERTRDPDTLHVWGDRDHTSLYSPMHCEGGDPDPTAMELSIIVARYCESTVEKLHPSSDMDMVFSFLETEDISPA